MKTLQFKPLHPTFAAEVIDTIDLCKVHDRDTLAAIRAGMSRYAVLVFRNQAFSGSEQLDFARRLDGELHAKTGASAVTKNRFGDEALTDISNVDPQGGIMAPDDRRRLYGLANRLWHTDASFQDPPGRYSMLFARVLPKHPPPTEFADTRTAYDRLDESLKSKLEGLQVHHSIAYSRETLGFEFAETEKAQLQGAVHPLVRYFPDNGRRALYVASHASRVLGWSLPEGRLLIKDLIERATAPDLIYRHAWQEADLVIWDNRATMHRAVAFDDINQRRELHRVTTLDLPLPGDRVRSA